MARKNVLYFLLISITVFAFAVRIINVDYGLPLWLVDDEPSLVISALKMLELKTLAPGLHQEDFANILYYPPYTSYLYLAPFVVLTGVTYLSLRLDTSYLDNLPFTTYLPLDLSSYFIMARFIGVIFGTLTIWFLYKTARQVFQDEIAAIISAFFLATSITHINLSTFAIHWVPATFITILGLWTITNDKFSFRTRSYACSLIAGIGFGFSIMSALVMLFPPLAYILLEKKPLGKIYREIIFYKAAVVFLALAAIPILLNPKSFGFFSDTTFANGGKTLVGAFLSVIWFLKPLTLVEPVLLCFALVGLWLIVSSRLYRGYGLTVIAFIAFYSVIFYYGFRFEERFTLPIIPVLSLTAGYGGSWLLKGLSRNKPVLIIILLLLAVPLTASVKLGWLKYKDDTRIQARTWIEDYIAPHSKIITYVDLMRVSSTPEAIAEQENIDSMSLRRVDKAERAFAKNPRGTATFHALNLYSATNEKFFDSLEDYLKNENYQYVLMGTKPHENLTYYPAFQSAVTNSSTVVTFGGENSLEYLTSGTVGSLFQLIKAQSTGPYLILYKIR